MVLPLACNVRFEKPSVIIMKIEAGWNLIQRWGRRALSRAASIGSHFFVIVWLFNINHIKVVHVKDAREAIRY
ncbi:MAG TPA: hypothetical protein DCL66_04080 [Gammaproteobacteria bacterium]|nr:hypothetical protein [Gammaproteobacteria bacterium]